MCNLLHISENAAIFQSVISRREFIPDVHGLGSVTSAQKSFAKRSRPGEGGRGGSRSSWVAEADHYDAVFASRLGRGGVTAREALTDDDDDVFVHV